MLPPATKLGQGNVFTGICDSLNGGGCLLLPEGGGCLLPGGAGGDPPGWLLLHAVRILLECILVIDVNSHDNKDKKMDQDYKYVSKN